MKLQSSSKYLLGTASALALLASSAAIPANAQTSTATGGIYVGGSTLASEAFRQIFDCNMGAIVGYNTAYSDGFSFDATFPGPGKLPTACIGQAVPVEGLYAGVGSGNGVRGFITNNPQQWYNGTLTPSTTANIPTATPLPAVQPSMIDLANPGTPVTKFGSYPYPRVDIGLSDSPLGATLAALVTSSVSFGSTQSWSTTGGSVTQITLNSTTQNVSYSTTVYGNPIQIPAFEVNVAIPVNTNSLTVHSAVPGTANTPGTQSTQGAAIQLSTAQLCAIFSGFVTDWNSTANIPYLNSAGTVQSTAFNATNVGDGHAVEPYVASPSSLPITVVYRSDGSGTSFILQNYLHAVCPLLAGSNDATTTKYQSIFGGLTPSTSFNDLINRIVAARGNGIWNATTTTAWVPASGSGGVASSISDTAGAKAGRIGYVSADFTRPYTTVVAGVGAPLSAALQNEDQRINGTTVPGTSGLTFIAPTPDAAGWAWSDSRLQQPATGWTWNDYNIYGNTFTTPVVQGHVTLSGQSVLPLTNVASAYPLSGTTFLDLYSCYNNADGVRVNQLRDFLTWYISGADATSANYDPDIAAVIENSGFHHLPDTYSQNIISEYLTSGSTALFPNYIQAAAVSQSNGCTNVANGADGGAK